MNKTNIIIIIFLILLIIISSYEKRWESPQTFLFIKSNKFINEVYTKKNKDKKDPIILPERFKWTYIDINNIDELYDLRRFLMKNYLQGGSYLCDNSIDMLRNSLFKRKQLGIRYEDNRLVGFIGRIPYVLQIYDKVVEAVEISYLSVHSIIRGYNIPPFLIREVTRIALNETKNKGAAIFVTSFEIPKYNKLLNFTTFFRPINYKKLVELNILPLVYRFDDITLYKFNFKCDKMEEKDISSAHILYSNYQKENYDIYYKFDYEGFKLLFYDHDEIISYVVKDSNGKVTDFVCISICTYNSVDSKLYYGKIMGYANSSVSIIDLMNMLIYKCYNLDLQYLICSGFGAIDTFKDKCGFIPSTFSGRLYLYNWLVTPTKKERLYINFNG